MCDLDDTIVAAPINPELAAKALSAQTRGEERCGITGAAEQHEQRQRQVAPDGVTSAKSVVEQAYYLWNAALRSIDIAYRAPEHRDSPGSVLTTPQIEAMRRHFIEAMARNLDERGQKVARMACQATIDIDADFRTLREGSQLKLLREKKFAAIHGWTSPERAFNHYSQLITEKDIDFIIKDYAAFTSALFQAL